MESRNSADKAQAVLNKAQRHARLAVKKETARAEPKPAQSEEGSEEGSAHSPVLIFLILVSGNLMLIFHRVILMMHRTQTKTQKRNQNRKQRKARRESNHSRRRRRKCPYKTDEPRTKRLRTKPNPKDKESNSATRGIWPSREEDHSRRTNRAEQSPDLHQNRQN